MARKRRPRDVSYGGFCCLRVAIVLFGIYATGLPAQAQKSDAEIIAPTGDFTKAESYEERPAGAATHFKIINVNTFSHASANMSFERELDFKVGNAFFRRIWVSSPSSTQSSDGLGPLFNARSCQRCHIKDGRGHPSENAVDSMVSAIIKLGVPAQTEDHVQALKSGRKTTIADPNYGGQLQDFSVPGVFAEGKVRLSYDEFAVTLNGGETVRLRKPRFSIIEQRYGELHKAVMTSFRVAPQMIGLGLLEAIDSDDILANEDIDDENGDGISGKANYVWDKTANRLALGRFGYKAGQPNLNQQNQAAFNNDIGISTPLFENPYGDCTVNQTDCLQMLHGNSGNEQNLEVGDAVAAQVLHYTRNLAVPARRQPDDPSVLKGKQLFYESGCIACHTPKYITPTANLEPEQSRQLIWPYTDLLLHDMGEGLADGFTEGRANGREWRTPPLWGIGLTPIVNGHSYYLHDGRARNLLEAIIWHGGESEASKQKVIAMSRDERQQLLAFIRSL